MFIDLPDTSSLKQGDIVKDIVFPLARSETVRFIGRSTGFESGIVQIEPVLDGTPQRPYHVIQVQGTIAPCAVLSQCCDVALNQTPPPHAFVLCKVVPVPKAIRKHPASHENLKSNLDPYGERRAYIQNFWFGLIPGMSDEYMADFSQVMTVSWNDYDPILKSKVAELDDLHRAMFRVKAGAHFGRVADEDKAAGYEDPYGREDVPPPPTYAFSSRLKKALRLLLGSE